MAEIYVFQLYIDILRLLSQSFEHQLGSPRDYQVVQELGTVQEKEDRG
jgi:hypothetical protein